MSSLVFADWTGPAGAIGSAAAAGLALVTIVYAKQAAKAARDAIGEGRKLRVEEDFREFGRAVWDLYQAADDARTIGGDRALNRMRHAQTRLTSVLVTPIRVNLDAQSTKILDQAMNRHSEPPTVYSATVHLVDALQDAWDAWEQLERGQTHLRRQLED